LEVVKGRLVGEEVRSASPLPVTVTEVPAEGAPERATVNVLLEPSGTVRLVGLATTESPRVVKVLVVQAPIPQAFVPLTRTW
jgi:hypothetical protein